MLSPIPPAKYYAFSFYFFAHPQRKSNPSTNRTAAAAGANLMLSGHTHNGQLWPFNYLVRMKCPLLGGRYEIEGMTVIVSRGAGAWGPRMRLWCPSEFLRITLRPKNEEK